MIVAGISQFIFMLLFLLGDSGTFQDYIDTEDYWADQGLEITVQDMRGVLAGPAQPPPDLSVWVNALGAERFEEREQAEKKLAEAGAAARPALEKALSSRDPEVKLRAKALLEKLPAEDPESIGEMQRMALLTLSRMEDAGAAELLREYHSPEKPAEEKKVLTRAQRLSRFPADTHVFVELQTRQHPGEVVKEIHHSPLIQEKLREFWMKTGDLRIDRISFSLNAEMLRMSSAGTGILWVEGQFEPEKLAGLLDEAGLNDEEDGSVWSRDGLIVALHPNQQEVFVLFNPDESKTFDELEDLGRTLVGSDDTENKIPEALKAWIPEENEAGGLWAAARMPEDSPGIPGLPSKLQTATLTLNRRDKGFVSEFSATFANKEGAEAVKSLVDGQLAEIRKEIEEHQVPEMERILKLLEDIELSTEEEQLRIQAPLPDPIRILMVRQMEKMLGMIQQMQQRHEQMLMDQEMH